MKRKIEGEEDYTKFLCPQVKDTYPELLLTS